MSRENQIVYKCDNDGCDNTYTHYPDRFGSRDSNFISVKLSKVIGLQASAEEEFHFCDISCLHEWSKKMLENMIYDKISKEVEDEASNHKVLEGMQGGPIDSFHQLPKGHPYEHPEKKYVSPSKISVVKKVGIKTHSVKI